MRDVRGSPFGTTNSCMELPSISLRDCLLTPSPEQFLPRKLLDIFVSDNRFRLLIVTSLRQKVSKKPYRRSRLNGEMFREFAFSEADTQLLVTGF